MNRISAVLRSVVALTVASTLAGCGADSGAEDGNVISFAGINPLTGPSASFGLRSQRGAQMHVDEINESGGITDKCGNNYQVKLSDDDFADDTAQAIALTRQAADNADVLAIIGPSSSKGFVPMVPIAGSMKIPIISSGAGAPIPMWNEYSFRVNATSGVAEPALLGVLEDEYDLDKVAVIYQSDQDAQAAGGKIALNLAEDIGYSVVSKQTFRANDTDFSAQVTAIKNSDAEWIAVYGVTPLVSQIARQVRQAGIESPMLFGIGAAPQDPEGWDLSHGALDGAYTWSEMPLDEAGMRVQKFLKEYGKRFDQSATLNSLYGYDAIGVAVEAVKISCSATDREAFIEALGTLKVDGLNGSVQFENPPTGENQTPTITVTKTTGRGEFEVIGTKSE